MKLTSLLCLIASVAADYTYIPSVDIVKAGAIYNTDPYASCQSYGCHECVLYGCSPVTHSNGGFTCANPGSSSVRVHARPTQMELFTRAKKCKDTLNICSSTTTTASGGLQNNHMGFKQVTPGSAEDITVPANYLCLAEFKSDEYATMRVKQMVGTHYTAVAAFFKLEYLDSRGLVTVYSNWQQFLYDKMKSAPIRTLNNAAEYFVGGQKQSTTQKVAFWTCEPGKKLSDLQFGVEFQGNKDLEYNKDQTGGSKWVLWVIIAVVVCIICFCIFLACINGGGGSGGGGGRGGGGIFIFGGGGYGDGGDGGGGGFGDFGGGGGGYGDGGDGGGGY